MTTLPDLEPVALEAARRGYEQGMGVSHVDCLRGAIRAYLAAARSTVPEAGKAVDNATAYNEALKWAVGVCDYAIENYKGVVAMKIRREIAVELSRRALASVPAPSGAPQAVPAEEEDTHHGR
jgi:hypothetical protein